MAVSQRQAERWLALEFVAVVVVRTIHGFEDQEALLGPQNYAAILAAYGFLSLLVLSSYTAELAAMLGLLVLLAVLLRPTSGPGEPLRTVGTDAAGAVAAFARNVGANSPSIAGGFR